MSQTVWIDYDSVKAPPFHDHFCHRPLTRMCIDKKIVMICEIEWKEFVLIARSFGYRFRGPWHTRTLGRTVKGIVRGLALDVLVRMSNSPRVKTVGCYVRELADKEEGMRRLDGMERVTWVVEMGVPLSGLVLPHELEREVVEYLNPERRLMPKLPNRMERDKAVMIRNILQQIGLESALEHEVMDLTVAVLENGVVRLDRE